MIKYENETSTVYLDEEICPLFEFMLQKEEAFILTLPLTVARVYDSAIIQGKYIDYDVQHISHFKAHLRF